MTCLPGSHVAPRSGKPIGAHRNATFDPVVGKGDAAGDELVNASELEAAVGKASSALDAVG